MAAAQTGTGKTAAFALPMLQLLAADGVEVKSNAVRALVLVPTRELAEQVHTSFRNYGGQLRLRTAVVYGGVSINPQMMAMRKGVDVLVATPGRLLDLQQRNAVKFDGLRLLVLDEADRMLDLGFARELSRLLALLPAQRQTLLFSATFSDAIRALAGQLLKQPVSIDVSPRNTTARTVDQWLIPVDKKLKAELFFHLLERHRWPQVLVFVKTRKGVQRLVAALAERGITADAIHGDRPQAARLRALQCFKGGELRVLVATDVAARGLDIQDLPLVCNFDLPIVAEDYVHRIGRTGRAGASGQAVSLVCADEAPQLQAVEALIRQTLPRREQPGFEPDHRVPLTGTGNAPAMTGKGKRKKSPNGRGGPVKRGAARSVEHAGSRPQARSQDGREAKPDSAASPGRTGNTALRRRPRLDGG